MIGPRRYWGAPPPVTDRWARADYFADWSPRVLPRRGERRPGGQRRYEIRMLMTGLVFSIEDDTDHIADIDVRGLLSQLEAQERSGAHHSDRFENEDMYWWWLRRALLEVIRRTGDLPPATPIPQDDLHFRDLESLRRVAEKMAGYLFILMDEDSP